MNIFKKKKTPLVVLLLDGLGVADPNPGNAVMLAKTPTLDYIWPRYQHTYLHASGNYVGLPTGVTGNSEVGHMSIGAGRIVFQEIAKIDNEIQDGQFFKNQTFLELINHAKTHSSNIHLMGCLSDGRVHSSIQHLFACLDFLKNENFPSDRVFVHAFTDGRDTPAEKAIEFLDMLDNKLNTVKVGRLKSIIGRFFSMDRDNRWERTEKAFNLIVKDEGVLSSNYRASILDSYAKGITDEFIEPIAIDIPDYKFSENDSVLFFNYRGDRAVQLSKCFEAPESISEIKIKKLSNIFFAGFSNYEKGLVLNRSKNDQKIEESEFVKGSMEFELKKTLSFPKNQIFPPTIINDSLGKIISDAGLSQLRLTESEKYPHVTYFLNCRNNSIFNREDRIEIPSPKNVRTYDLKPEMSTFEITDTLLNKTDLKKYDFIFVNFALTDMVAHTGNLEASIKCVEVADKCCGEIIKKVISIGGEVIITSDHGNVEELINMLTGQVDTQHSVNPVPFIYINQENKNGEMQFGMLADIAPTILQILDVAVPSSMTGRILI